MNHPAIIRDAARGSVGELASLLAAGVLRLHQRNVLAPASVTSTESPNSAPACLEVSFDRPLSVTTTGVNAVETTTHRSNEL
jgi:hypothetical protein